MAHGGSWKTKRIGAGFYKLPYGIRSNGIYHVNNIPPSKWHQSGPQPTKPIDHNVYPMKSPASHFFSRHWVGTNIFLGHQSRKPGPVTQIQKHAISSEANCFGRKTCRGGNLSKKDADMSWKLIRPWSHTHTSMCTILGQKHVNGERPYPWTPKLQPGRVEVAETSKHWTHQKRPSIGPLRSATRGHHKRKAAGCSPHHLRNWGEQNVSAVRRDAAVILLVNRNWNCSRKSNICANCT